MADNSPGRKSWAESAIKHASPEGTAENSPGWKSWVESSIKHASREGTKEPLLARPRSVVPPGLVGRFSSWTQDFRPVLFSAFPTGTNSVRDHAGCRSTGFRRLRYYFMQNHLAIQDYRMHPGHVNSKF